MTAVAMITLAVLFIVAGDLTAASVWLVGAIVCARQERR